MFDTASAPEFAEGTLDLASEVWFCVDHSQSVKIGKACPFCKFDELGPVEFEKWLASVAS